MYGTSYAADDPLTDRVDNFSFSDKSIRRGFIRKVYGILVVQLLITVSFIAWFTYHQATKQYVRSHMGIWWAAFAVMIVCLITMACCGDVRRKAPLNFIFLFIFTLAQSFMLGVAASTYDTDAISKVTTGLSHLTLHNQHTLHNQVTLQAKTRVILLHTQLLQVL